LVCLLSACSENDKVDPTFRMFLRAMAPAIAICIVYFLKSAGSLNHSDKPKKDITVKTDDTIFRQKKEITDKPDDNFSKIAIILLVIGSVVAILSAIIGIQGK
ncbi:MAG: hypothetical protein ACOVNZ_06140, partial [Crocinitomicaceae bacterium]